MFYTTSLNDFDECSLLLLLALLLVGSWGRLVRIAGR